MKAFGQEKWNQIKGNPAEMMWFMTANFKNDNGDYQELIQKMNWWAGSDDADYGEVFYVSIEKNHKIW